MAGFKGLRPPAAGPLPWILECRWLVIAGCGLPAGECWFAVPCLLILQGKQEASRGPRKRFRWAWEGSRRVPRWLEGAFDRAPGAMGGPWDGPRTSRGGHERFELTFFSVWGPSGALSLRFSMFGGLRRSRCTPVQRNRPRPRNTGTRKSGGPSDALALRLCSEIAQGQV